MTFQAQPSTTENSSSTLKNTYVKPKPRPKKRDGADQRRAISGGY